MRDWQPFLGLPLWVWLFVFPAAIALFCLVQRKPAERLLSPVWRFLDRVYLYAGVIAAGFMVTILLLIVAQMIARWSGLTFPGSTEYAGYAMAATSFFALAHTLTRGGHIRVSIFLNMNRHTAYAPYEILVSGNKIYALHARFRIALSFPDLGMTTFTKIIKAPGAIQRALTAVATGE